MRKCVASLLLVITSLLTGLTVPAQQSPRQARPVTPASLQMAANLSPLNGLDEFISSVMNQWKVPGLAIAVIHNDQVILSKGYGYRDVEKKLPVTPKTLFAIGSITKSFTVCLLSMLADEGKLDWDKPVRSYLPDFQLKDQTATEQMTPRDLVTHRSGLPRHDGLWYGSQLTRRQMYERLRHLEPSKAFRSTYQYNNLMFMTAGILAEQITGTKWETLVQQRLFQPLGMTQSNCSVNDSQKAADVALPYVRVNDELKQVPFRNIDEVGPAGSINSNVEEMIRYVQLHINKGKHGDKQLVSQVNAEQMQTPQMVIPPGPVQYDELGHAAYGLGFVINTYRGHKYVEHDGGIDGFIARMSFMPRQKIGMVILTNQSGNNPVAGIISRQVYDRLLGLDPVDWTSRIREQQERARKAEEENKQKNRLSRKSGTSPSHSLTDYVGTYEHPGYGTVKVELSGSELKLNYNGLTSRLQHVHYNVFEVPEDPMNPLQQSQLMFLYNKKGEVDRLTVPLEPNVSDIVFSRVADEAMRQVAFLSAFVGQYEISGVILTVALQGDTLTLTVPGQPTYELVPTRGTSFDLKGLSGFTVEFTKNASGTVTEAIFYQPNGTFVAKRK